MPFLPQIPDPFVTALLSSLSLSYAFGRGSGVQLFDPPIHSNNILYIHKCIRFSLFGFSPWRSPASTLEPLPTGSPTKRSPNIPNSPEHPRSRTQSPPLDPISPCFFVSPPVLQLIVKRRAGGHGTSLKKVTCARIRSHLSLLH